MFEMNEMCENVPIVVTSFHPESWQFEAIDEVLGAMNDSEIAVPAVGEPFLYDPDHFLYPGTAGSERIVVREFLPLVLQVIREGTSPEFASDLGVAYPHNGEIALVEGYVGDGWCGMAADELAMRVPPGPAGYGLCPLGPGRVQGELLVDPEWFGSLAEGVRARALALSVATGVLRAVHLLPVVVRALADWHSFPPLFNDGWSLDDIVRGGPAVVCMPPHQQAALVRFWPEDLVGKWWSFYFDPAAPAEVRWWMKPEVAAESGLSMPEG